MTNTEFIAHAFAGVALGELPWVASFPGDVANAPDHIWFGAPAIPLPSFIRGTNNNYVCISSFKHGDDGRVSRRKNCWSGLWLIMLDDLGSGGSAKVDIKRLILEPSCLVETSPGNHQAWYFLTAPERDRSRADALISGLLDAGASDPGAGSLTRYGRLPVGINGKATYAANGKPWTQRLHIWEPSRRYSVDEIADAYRLDLAPKRRTRQSSRLAPANHASDLVALLDWAGLYLEDMRGSGYRVICPWHEGHTGRDTTGTAYFPPSDENNWRGGFICHHGHCKTRNINDLNAFLAGLSKLKSAKKVAA